MTGIIIDASIILLISLSIFIGYKQGFIKVAIKIFSFIIAIAIAFAIYKPVSNVIIEKTPLDENIEYTITNNIKVNKGETFEIKGFPEGITQSIVGEANNTIENISNTITIKIIQAVTFFAIFIVVKILLKFISVIADIIAKLPILKQFNKLGGTIYGGLKGFAIIYLILAIILLLAPLMQNDIISLINESYIGSLMYNNNILIKLIF